MAIWLGIILAALKSLAALIGWRENSQLIDAGAAEEQNAQLKKDADEIARATKVRDKARTDSAAIAPSVSLSDDGFRRD